jgi:hypothetical protein
MSTETQEAPEMMTRPVAEHEWLKKLLGVWKIETEMSMGPGEPTMTSTGTETVTSLGGLFAFGEGKNTMPNGMEMIFKSAIGYDVSFKEYRAVWFASVSSHIWKSTGVLSEDGKTLTLNCVGPNMVKDGETANYRDVIQLIDDNHRTLTSFGEDENGNWNQFMKASYTRI